jgi:hypothetical protein
MEGVFESFNVVSSFGNSTGAEQRIRTQQLGMQFYSVYSAFFGADAKLLFATTPRTFLCYPLNLVKDWLWLHLKPWLSGCL